MTVRITSQSDPLPCSFLGVLITVPLFTCQLPDHTHGLRASSIYIHYTTPDSAVAKHLFLTVAEEGGSQIRVLTRALFCLPSDCLLSLPRYGGKSEGIPQEPFTRALTLVTGAPSLSPSSL